MNQELEKLQGTWKIVALEVDGNQMPASAFNGSRIVVKGDSFKSLSMGATYEGTMLVDGASHPKSLDMKFTDGPEKGNTNLAIYEIAGDTWKLCINMRGKGRPKTFASAAGSGVALETLERESKAAAVDQALEIDLPPVPELEGEWRMVSCIRDGAPLEPMMVKSGRRVAKGNQTTTLFGKMVFSKSKYAVDRTKSPKTIDFYLETGQKQQGIYELEGGNFRVCFGAADQARPAEFASVAGDGRTLTVWSRVKK